MCAMRLPQLPFISRTAPRRHLVDDRVVLITGGARGIGAATAHALASRGAKVVLTDVDPAALEQTRAAIARDVSEDAVMTVVADVCDYSAMQEAVAQATARFGGVDVVVANAGIASYGSVMEVDPETFKRVVDVNVTGVFNTVRAALPSVVEREGYVLVVSSLAAFVPAPGMAAYNASKAGVEHFANALRVEVAHRGVDVGCAHMSWIDTPLVRDAREDLQTFDEMIKQFPAPLNRTSPVETCVDAFIDAIETRTRTVFVPGWVAGIGKARELARRVSERQVMSRVPTMLPRMDAEVRSLGRATSARNVAHQQTGVEGSR
jgi:NAD(P)-dependent dehydrogenase (short-subunit alcohol dehydrogenase family)